MKEIKCDRYRTHAIFDCRTCGERWEDYNTSREKAYQHARKTGHFVSGEVGTAYHYNGNP